MDDRSQERNKQKALATLKDKLFALHVEEQQDKLTKARRS
jgi:protein subunit release factor A